MSRKEHAALGRFLAAAAEARDVTDLNIAAGVALEELETPRHRIIHAVLSTVMLVRWGH